MERKPLIVANWKMNKTVDESLDFVEEFLPMLPGVDDVDVALAPPFTSLVEPEILPPLTLADVRRGVRGISRLAGFGDSEYVLLAFRDRLESDKAHFNQSNHRPAFFRDNLQL